MPATDFALNDLATRCETARPDSRVTDMEWDLHFACERTEPEPLAYTASLDAAMILLPESWDHISSSRSQGQWTVRLIRSGDFGHWSSKGTARSHALAICAAALRARIMLRDFAAMRARNVDRSGLSASHYEATA